MIRNRTSQHGIHAILLAAAALVATLLAPGCETPPPPFVPKADLAPQVVYCNDHTGHVAGSRPWILGGTCCCTPTDALMAQLHRDGFCQGMSAEDLAKLYEAKGIALRRPGHEHCCGLCDKGPHVVLGGKCMCPPTPGTDYYEKVVFAPRRTVTVAGGAAPIGKGD